MCTYHTDTNTAALAGMVLAQENELGKLGFGTQPYCIGIS